METCYHDVMCCFIWQRSQSFSECFIVRPECFPEKYYTGTFANDNNVQTLKH